MTSVRDNGVACEYGLHKFICRWCDAAFDGRTPSRERAEGPPDLTDWKARAEKAERELSAAHDGNARMAKQLIAAIDARDAAESALAEERRKALEHDEAATRWAHLYNGLYHSLEPWLRKRACFIRKEVVRGETLLAAGPESAWKAGAEEAWNVNANGWREMLPEYRAELGAIDRALASGNAPEMNQEKGAAAPRPSLDTEEWRDELWETHLRVGFPGSEEDARFLMLGLCGEVGELANLIKKQWRRDDYPAEKRKQELAAEFADVRADLYMLGRALGLDEEAVVAEHVIPKCRTRWPRISSGERPAGPPEATGNAPDDAELLRQVRDMAEWARDEHGINVRALLAQVEAAERRDKRRKMIPKLIPTDAVSPGIRDASEQPTAGAPEKAEVLTLDRSLEEK